MFLINKMFSDIFVIDCLFVCLACFILTKTTTTAMTMITTLTTMATKAMMLVNCITIKMTMLISPSNVPSYFLVITF